MTLQRKTPRAGHSATGREMSVDNGLPDFNAQFSTWQRLGAVLARMGVLP